MNADELTQQFEEFLGRARGFLGREIIEARKTLDNLTVEKTGAAQALATLTEQRSSAQSQLDSIVAHLNRASELASIDSEVSKARSDLEKLNAEKRALEVSIAALAQQREDSQRQLVVLGDEARRWIAIRTEGEAVMAHLRAQLRSVQIGQQS